MTLKDSRGRSILESVAISVVAGWLMDHDAERLKKYFLLAIIIAAESSYDDDTLIRTSGIIFHSHRHNIEMSI